MLTEPALGVVCVRNGVARADALDLLRVEPAKLRHVQSLDTALCLDSAGVVRVAGRSEAT